MLTSFYRSLALCLLFFCLSETVFAYTPEATIQLNVQDGELRDLVKWVSQSTGRKVIIDPRVQGKVTVLANNTMNADEAWQTLLSVLQVHGYAAVETDGVTKIVPDSIARMNTIPVVDGKKQGGDDLVIRIIKPKHISASKLEAVLRPIQPPTAYLAAPPETNALIIADRAGNINKMAAIIERIDNANEQSMELVELKFAGAEAVVTTLQAMFQDTSGNNSTNFQLAMDSRTNSVLVSGDINLRKKVREVINALDRPGKLHGNTPVVYLHYLKAQEMAGILKGVMDGIKQDSRDASVTNASLSIEPSETTNALVLTAPPKLMDTMVDVIKKLDIRRAQVLVEAIIVEVKEGKGSELGVQWRSEPRGDSNNGIRIGTHFPSSDGPSFADFEKGTLGAGLNLGFYHKGSFKALVKAMATDDTFNILSTPTLVTLDNEEAKIVIGQNVPFVTGQQTGSSSSTDNPFQTITRNDIGTKLSVKPRVNGGDAITLKVSQEISSINTKTKASDIVTDTRSLETSVLIRDGDILVLGGLINDEVVQSRSKVPLLGDIPLLGALFRSERNEIKKRNLMLFMKPTILNSYDQAAMISQGRYRFIQNRQKQFSDKLGAMTRWQGGTTVLPDIETLRAGEPVTFDVEEKVVN